MKAFADLLVLFKCFFVIGKSEVVGMLANKCALYGLTLFDSNSSNYHLKETYLNLNPLKDKLCIM